MRDLHGARLAAVFGDAFPVLGVFPLGANAPVRRCLQPANQAALRGGDPLAASHLDDPPRTRPAGVDALWHLLTGAEATSGYDADSFAVPQAPQHDGQRWAALAVRWGRTARSPARRSPVTVHTPGRRRCRPRWPRWRSTRGPSRLPSAEETAGLAFHYDAPSNRAPQSAVARRAAGTRRDIRGRSS